MSVRGIMRTALWTEIREALLKDFPGLDIPMEAPAALAKVVVTNADYMTELTGQPGAKFLEALTPSAGTRDAYMQKFRVPFPVEGENGEDDMRQVNVPWTVIQEVMAAIKDRAENPLPPS